MKNYNFATETYSRDQVMDIVVKRFPFVENRLPIHVQKLDVPVVPFLFQKILHAKNLK